ncbi:MAG: hypothetical protein ACK6DI_11795 [Betaproteobacteria bacterium]
MVEGDLEVAVTRCLFESSGLPIPEIKNCRGGPSFWKDARRFNRSAREIGPLFGLVDLEGAECAPGLLANKLGGPPATGFLLRVAERRIESWLLADRHALAAFLGVAVSRIPTDPERERDPKQVIVNLARGSKRRAIREAVAPPARMQGVKVGPEYLPTMRAFVQNDWDARRAAERSDSLRRARQALMRLA